MLIHEANHGRKRIAGQQRVAIKVTGVAGPDILMPRLWFLA